MRRLTTLIAGAGVITTVGAGACAQVGDAAAGRAFAQEVCTPCAAVESVAV